MRYAHTPHVVDETLRLWGDNIRAVREGLTPERLIRRSKDQPCLTQAQLGELLDPPVTQSTVARWEAGRYEPRRHYKRQLAHVLGTDVRFLFPMVGAAS
jgi:DNA-binding XRE family transcriptional regulator